ncbi:hypothetical protein BGX38DRAFT_282306 [Terfezia claveryi]|nr:hypothetical protein BGX38DRAFT_282306 [Terfezia claveryi]
MLSWPLSGYLDGLRLSPLRRLLHQLLLTLSTTAFAADTVFRSHCVLTTAPASIMRLWKNLTEILKITTTSQTPTTPNLMV